VRLTRALLSIGTLAASAALVTLGVAPASTGPKHAIELAAAAPFHDALLRDAPALCADLTPAAEATIAPASAPVGADCETAASDVFTATTTTVPANATVTVLADARKLTVSATHATGVFALTTEAYSGSGVKLGYAGLHRLAFEEIAGRWLVSSQARLASIPDCQLNPPGHCHPGVQRLLFVVGETLPQRLDEALPIPKAVRRAGGRVLREFEAGASVTAHSGCLACHKIGSVGNRGPGPNLSHVGDRLGSRQIEQALISTRAPMPSFKRLPRRKLHAIVRFLSLLR
jgi:hypothetical protein